MKTLLLIGGILLCLVLGYFMYAKFFSKAAMGEKVFEDLKNGKINPETGLYKNPVQNTDIIAKDRLLGSNPKPSFQEIREAQKKIFNFPTVREHELVSSSESTKTYRISVDISREEYDADPTYQLYNPTFESFQAQFIGIFSHCANYRFDKTLGQLYFDENFKQLDFTYVINTGKDKEQLKICFLKIGKEYKLASLYTVHLPR